MAKCADCDKDNGPRVQCPWCGWRLCRLCRVSGKGTDPRGSCVDTERCLDVCNNGDE